MTMRNRKPFILLAMLLTLTLLAAGCTPKAGIEGKWVPDESALALLNMDGMGSMMGITLSDPVMEFKDGKVFVTYGGKDLATLMMEAQGIDPNEAPTVPPGSEYQPGPNDGMTYKVDGNKVILTTTAMGISQETAADYVLDGDTLKLTAEGETLTFTRAK